MVCFEKQLAAHWYRIYKCILDIGLKLQGKGVPTSFLQHVSVFRENPFKPKFYTVVCIYLLRIDVFCVGWDV